MIEGNEIETAADLHGIMYIHGCMYNIEYTCRTSSFGQSHDIINI